MCIGDDTCNQILAPNPKKGEIRRRSNAAAAPNRSKLIYHVEQLVNYLLLRFGGNRLRIERVVRELNRVQSRGHFVTNMSSR